MKLAVLLGTLAMMLAACGGADEAHDPRTEPAGGRSSASIGLGHEVPLGTGRLAIDETLAILNSEASQATATVVVSEGRTEETVEDLTSAAATLGVVDHAAIDRLPTYRIHLDTRPSGPLQVEFKVPGLGEEDIASGRISSILVHALARDDEDEESGWSVADSVLDWMRRTETVLLEPDLFQPDPAGGHFLRLRLQLLQGATDPPAGRTGSLLKEGSPAQGIHCPLRQCVETGMFGPRVRERLNASGTTVLRNGTHGGIDLYAPAPEEILGEARGRIVFAITPEDATGPGAAPSTKRAGGRVEVELPDGSLVKYFHLSSVRPAALACNDGAARKREACVIGGRGPFATDKRIGTTGNSGAPGTPFHLHFEVHSRSKPKTCRGCPKPVYIRSAVDPFPLLLHSLSLAAAPPAQVRTGAPLRFSVVGRDAGGKRVASNITTDVNSRLIGNKRFLCASDRQKLLVFPPSTAYGLTRNAPMEKSPIPVREFEPVLSDAPVEDPGAVCQPWTTAAEQPGFFGPVVAFKEGTTTFSISYTSDKVERSPLPSARNITFGLQVNAKGPAEVPPIWSQLSLPFSSRITYEPLSPCAVTLATSISADLVVTERRSSRCEPPRPTLQGTMVHGYTYGYFGGSYASVMTSASGGQTAVAAQGQSHPLGPGYVVGQGNILVDPRSRVAQLVSLVNGRSCVGPDGGMVRLVRTEAGVSVVQAAAGVAIAELRTAAFEPTTMGESYWDGHFQFVAESDTDVLTFSVQWFTDAAGARAPRWGFQFGSRTEPRLGCHLGEGIRAPALN